MTSAAQPFNTLRVLAVGSLASAAYVGTGARRLVTTYPLYQGSSAPPSSASLWPSGLSEPVEVRARTRIRRGADPREALVTAFYSAWTMRYESFIAHAFGISPSLPPPKHMPPGASPYALAKSRAKPFRMPMQKPDPDYADRPAAAPYTPPPTPAAGVDVNTADDLPHYYASGLFPVLGRTKDSTMMWATWWGFDERMGGAQLLTCTRIPVDGERNEKTEEVQISLACAETPFVGSRAKQWAGKVFHHMYMRFLIDGAARRMKRSAGDG